MPSKPPLSLYIHIPWCIKKCPYCDFNSHQSPGDLPEERYVTALLADLQADLSLFEKQPIESIFIGGGTPSLFSANAFNKLLHGIQEQCSFSNAIEITLEANPGTVEQGRFTDYRALGINRLSLGIQSFNAVHLKALGRIHNDKEAHRAIDYARQAGFDNINLDIMHGLPNQTSAEGIQDLRLALEHNPEHLSWYQLTIEPNTVFYKTRPSLPTDDEAYALEEEGLALLDLHQFKRYEISAFCKKKPSHHNLNYWLFGDYIGIGAGAHGKGTSADGQHLFRTQKQRQPNDYLNPTKPFLAAKNDIGVHDRIFEFMLNTTRLQEAIPQTLFTERTGLNLAHLMPTLLQAEAKGLLTITNTHWQITPFGRQFTNDLQALFLPP